MKSVISSLVFLLAFALSVDAQIFSTDGASKKGDKKENSKDGKKGKKDKDKDEPELINTDIDAEALRFLDSLGVAMGGKTDGKDSTKKFTMGAFNPFNSKEKLEEGEFTFPEPMLFDPKMANEYRSYLLRKSNNISEDKPAVMVKAAADRYQLAALRNAKGNELMNLGFYDHAFILFDQMVSVDPNLKGVQFNAGYCILQGYGNPSRAIPYLKAAILNTTYKPTVPYFEYAPTEAIYWLGVAYHRLGNLEEAERKYKLFLSVSKNNSPFFDEANVSLAQLLNGKRFLTNPGNGKIINAENINSPYADIAAQTYNFNGSLVFASARISSNEITDTTWFHSKLARADFDLYTAERNVYLEWENPTKAKISGPYDDYPVRISQDGGQIELFQGRWENSDIFMSTNGLNSTKINGRVFTDQQSQAWSPYVAISPDGTKAVFAARMDDGYGGLDLYYTKKDDYGQWSTPVNMGENINSPYDETTPTFHPNGKSIYFANNGPNSMGGFDIFKSNIEETGIFSTPENMKPPINSFYDDIYFSYSADGAYGFVSRNGGKLNKGDFDIYEINFKAINFSLNQSEDRYRGLESEKSNTVGKNYVQVNNLMTKTAERIAKSDRTGKYYVILQPCTSYRIEYFENGRSKSQETFATSCDLGLNDRKLELSPADFGNIEATIKQRGMRKALQNEYERNASSLKWQVFVDNVPYEMANKEVNLLDSNGNIIKSFKTDYQGKFNFNLIPDNQDYIFEVEVLDKSICDRLKVVLKRGDVMLQDYTFNVHQCF